MPNYVEIASQSDAFRRVIETGDHAQLVVMTIQPWVPAGTLQTKADADAAEH